MPGATPELNLATAVDADDNADYLTLSLANSLRTVDALFNNISGHTHLGAHQGGPIAPPANGSITSAMIADGTITSADIADGTIQMIDIAAGAVGGYLGGYNAVPTWSTTAVGTWQETSAQLSFTVVAGSQGLIDINIMALLQHSVASAQYVVGFYLDHAVQLGLNYGLFPTTPTGNFTAWAHWRPVVAPGSHTVSIGVINYNAGTLQFSNSGPSIIQITELRK
jgi:hypothetical protein